MIGLQTCHAGKAAPPQIGSRAQNRACGALAPRPAPEASEGLQKHAIQRSRRILELPGAAEARSGPTARALERIRCPLRHLRTFVFDCLSGPSHS